MDTTDDLRDLIPINEARRLLPSSQPGKRLALPTLYRWVHSGKLPAVRILGHYYVRRADLLALVEPVQPRRPAERETAPAARAKWVEEGLRRHGLL